jgi:hypothetical protein
MPKTPTDYSNTVIYKIVSKDLDLKFCYVGSTTNFIKRKYKHKSDSTNEKSTKQNYKLYKTINDNGGWYNFDIVEIEKYPCLDGNEARARERYYCELLNVNLNTLVPNRTVEEYRIQEQEKIKLCQKTWKQNNKEYVKERNLFYKKQSEDYLKK